MELFIKKYGSVEEYFESIGVSKEHVERIKSKLCSPQIKKESARHIRLVEVTEEEIPVLHDMQVKSFMPLYESIMMN